MGQNDSASMNARTGKGRIALCTLPEHVPADLVIPFDFFSDSELRSDPFSHVRRLFNLPRVFYTPEHYAKPGAWVVSRNQDVRYVLQHRELLYSAGSVGYSKLIGEHWD